MMATLKPIDSIQTKSHLAKAVSYIMKPEKTMGGKLISGENVIAFSPGDVLDGFLRTKEFYRKTDQRLAYHWEQSFKPGEVDPALAHKIGLEFVNQILPGFEVVVATHVDRAHIHNHFIWNSVSLETGLKYHQPKSLLFEYGKISDRLCLKYGLSVVPEKDIKTKRRSPSFAEVHPGEANKKTVHNFIYEDFDLAIDAADSLDDFFRILRDEMGYGIKRREEITHTAVAPDGHKFFRLYKFAAGYTEEDVARRIEEKLQGRTTKEASKETDEETVLSAGISASGKERYTPGRKPAFVPRATAMQYHVMRIRHNKYFVRRYNRRSLRETYLQYRFALHKVKQKRYPKYPPFELRRELEKLEMYTQETVLLVSHRIDTLEQLATYKAALDVSVSESYKEIGCLKSQLKRSRKKPLTELERKERQERLLLLKKQVAPLVREQHLCLDILQHSQGVLAATDKEKEIALVELEEQRVQETEYQYGKE